MYLFYFSKPTPFLTDEQVVEEINRIFPEANASIIQDTIPVDERHIVVPFISNKNDYSLSYWVWQKRKWRVSSINTKGQPMIWKIDKKDTSSYHFVWNIHPEDQLSSINFYLIRDREYYITEGTHHYFPRIQMEKRATLEEKPYGLMRLPNEWRALMDSMKTIESAKQHDFFFTDFFPGQNLLFGWLPYDQADNQTFPERSVNGHGFLNRTVDIEHVMILNTGDIELLKLQ